MTEWLQESISGQRPLRTKGTGLWNHPGPEGREAGHSPGSGRPMSTMDQQGTGGGMEHHGVAGGGRGPATCWNHLLPVAATGAVESETEEARGEEVVLGAATRHIEPDVIH